jgi:hypothetical protein
MQSISVEFLARVEAHLAATGTKPSEFGRAAVGDSSFVLHLRRGRSPKLATVDRVLAFMAATRTGAAGPPPSCSGHVALGADIRK